MKRKEKLYRVVPIVKPCPNLWANMTKKITDKHWSEETRWKPLAAAVADLKRQVEAAYYACDDDAASAAHDDLTRAEWRLRQSDRGVRRG